MTFPRCLPGHNFPALLLAILLGLTAAHPVPAQDAVASVSDFTITAIAFDDGWQQPLRNPSALHYDSKAGEVFVADAGNHRVVIYDSELRPKYSFDHFVPDQRSGRTIKGEPRDVAVNSVGEILLIDNLASYVGVFDYRGKLLEKIYPKALYGDTSLAVKPQCLAVDEADNLYVAVSGDVTTVLVLDSLFNLKRMIGQRGGGEADFSSPMACYVHRGKLYVTDLYANPAVKVFDTAGTFLFGFAGHDIDRGDVSFPAGITVMETSSGNIRIWVADGLRQVIKVFDETGEFSEVVGGYGFNPGEFRYPSDIADLGGGAFCVVERIGNRIQRFQTK